MARSRKKTEAQSEPSTSESVTPEAANHEPEMSEQPVVFREQEAPAVPTDGPVLCKCPLRYVRQPARAPFRCVRLHRESEQQAASARRSRHGAVAGQTHGHGRGHEGPVDRRRA